MFLMRSIYSYTTQFLVMRSSKLLNADQYLGHRCSIGATFEAVEKVREGALYPVVKPFLYGLSHFGDWIAEWRLGGLLMIPRRK